MILAATYNKNIMVGILLAGKALLKSPYVKRYVVHRVGIQNHSILLITRMVVS
jgi:hypothetical protein